MTMMSNRKCGTTFDRRPRGWLAAILASALLAGSLSGAHAVLPDEMLKDEKLEARARVLSQELRCVVCQNQSIDDSNAPLAHDLRVLVRERLSKGDSDRQVIDYIVARYGNFVLLKPPIQFNTWLLWLGPFLLLGAAGWGFLRFVRAQDRPEPTAAASLTDDETKRLAALLEEKPAR